MPQQLKCYVVCNAYIRLYCCRYDFGGNQLTLLPNNIYPNKISILDIKTNSKARFIVMPNTSECIIEINTLTQDNLNCIACGTTILLLENVSLISNLEKLGGTSAVITFLKSIGMVDINE